MSKLVKVAYHGLSSLEPCQVVPAEVLLTPAPTEHGTVIFSENSQTCGMWQATPYAEQMDGYPCNEMAHVLSGRIVITPDGEEPMVVNAGETYFMQKGFIGRFEVVETCTKYYFTVE